jgi:hypothetical protein
MPKDIGVDWKLVELEYLRGTRVVDVVNLYKIKQSTLEARIRRHGWVAKRLALRDVVQVKNTDKTVQTMSTRASSYLERVVKQVDAGMDALEASAPATVREIDQHFEALGKIDKIARPALGLTDQGTSTKGSLINISVLQHQFEPVSVKPCNVESLEDKPQVINIEAVAT